MTGTHVCSQRPCTAGQRGHTLCARSVSSPLEQLALNPLCGGRQPLHAPSSVHITCSVSLSALVLVAAQADGYWMAVTSTIALIWVVALELLRRRSEGELTSIGPHMGSLTGGDGDGQVNSKDKP